MFQRRFNNVLRVLSPGSLKSVSRVFKGFSKDVARVLEEFSKGVPKIFHGCYLEFLDSFFRVFQVCFKGSSRCFKSISWVSHECLIGKMFTQ